MSYKNFLFLQLLGIRGDLLLLFLYRERCGAHPFPCVRFHRRLNPFFFVFSETRTGWNLTGHVQVHSNLEAKKKKNIKSETPIGIYPSISVNKEKQQKNKKKPATKCVWWWCGPWGSLVGAVGPVMTPVGHRNVVPLIFFPSFPSWKKKKSLKPSN